MRNISPPSRFAPVRNRTTTSLAVVLSIAAAITCTPANAERGARNYYNSTDVVAHSRYGNGVISGPVRAGKHTWEVRLPGGTWVSCRRSCEETLRVETVDRYEGNARDIGSGTLLNECGVFGCLDIVYPR